MMHYVPVFIASGNWNLFRLILIIIDILFLAVFNFFAVLMNRPCLIFRNFVRVPDNFQSCQFLFDF